ncbi:hypothetical protein [Pseudomarimonas arenosa]|uniref:Uncharacterized protein n=1 Tax=Pseudomarimonas arenosa TaxID=2774145 RepID=A0AAW3ZHJ4_9GAMM|nr:hypothetical protein [Pseudomarimonas arenosa]MBD8524592.1 hypothetical protein [Pseudomarimonas arenosa]
MPLFKFHPRWKEELVCEGPGGRFILQLPMGVLSAYLPGESVWPRVAPDWARDLWPQLHAELQTWCRENGAELLIDNDTPVLE